MRILHLVHQYMPDNIGGTELYTRWVTQALVERGHQVTIFYRRNAEGEGLDHRMEEGVAVYAAWAGVRSPTQRFLATFRDPPMAEAFRFVFQKFNPDIVHIEHMMGFPLSLPAFISRQSIPFVVTLHDFWWVCANAQLLTNYSQEICNGPRGYVNCARCALARVETSLLWPLVPPLMSLFAGRNYGLRRVLRAASWLMTPTSFVRDWYIEHGVSPEKLSVLPLALPSPATRPDAKRLTDKPVRFAYIGGLSWQKGLHVLIEAFREVKGAVELCIAGDETFDPEYVARLRAMATSNVRFLGKLERAQVWDTLAQVDVVVVPTLWYETFSFIISEAFTVGLPVVASRIGPITDRVRDGVDGMLLPPGDVQAWRAALQRLVDKPGLRAELQRCVSPPLTVDDHTRQLAQLYGQFVG